jgi:WD40 repeat protein
MLLIFGAGFSPASNDARPVQPELHPPSSASTRASIDTVAIKVAEFKEDDDVSGLEFSPDGSRLAVSTFTKLHVHLWTWKDKARIERTFLKPAGTASYTDSDAVRYSPDGRFLAVVHTFDGDENGSGVVRTFDADTGAVAHIVAEPKGGGDRSKIVFSPDGKYLLRTYSSSTKDRDQFVVHRVDTWEKVWGLSTIPLDIMALAASPNGDLVAVGGVTLGPGVTHVAQILVIDLKARQIVRTIDDVFPKYNQVEQLAWSPDGLTIAAGGISGGTYSSPDAVRTFDASTGKLIASEPSVPAHVTGLRFTSNGKYLVESGLEGGVRIWDGQHKSMLHAIPAKHDYAIAVSGDGAYLAIGDAAHVVIWALR